MRSPQQSPSETNLRRLEENPGGRKQPSQKLKLESARQHLIELWLFAVAPEICNLACTHCLYTASPKRRNRYRLTRNGLDSLMEQVKTLGASPHFLFTGGEPTLHPEIFDLLEATERSGFIFQIMTNGSRINGKTAERLAQMSRLAKVQVSLESADARTADSIRGKGIYRRILKSLDHLRERGIATTLAVSIMASNEGTLPKIKKLAARKGADLKTISLYDLGAAKENGLKTTRLDGNGNGNTAPDLMCEKGVAYSEEAFYPCPILVKEQSAKLGDSLEQALSPEARRRLGRLREDHPACQVCLRGST